jgi:hypothetical protein
VYKTIAVRRNAIREVVAFGKKHTAPTNGVAHIFVLVGDKGKIHLRVGHQFIPENANSKGRMNGYKVFIAACYCFKGTFYRIGLEIIKFKLST